MARHKWMKRDPKKKMSELPKAYTQVGRGNIPRQRGLWVWPHLKHDFFCLRLMQSCELWVGMDVSELMKLWTLWNHKQMTRNYYYFYYYWYWDLLMLSSQRAWILPVHRLVWWTGKILERSSGEPTQSSPFGATNGRCWLVQDLKWGSRGSEVVRYRVFFFTRLPLRAVHSEVAHSGNVVKSWVSECALVWRGAFTQFFVMWKTSTAVQLQKHPWILFTKLFVHPVLLNPLLFELWIVLVYGKLWWHHCSIWPVLGTHKVSQSPAATVERVVDSYCGDGEGAGWRGPPLVMGGAFCEWWSVQGAQRSGGNFLSLIRGGVLEGGCCCVVAEPRACSAAFLEPRRDWLSAGFHRGAPNFVFYIEVVESAHTRNQLQQRSARERQRLWKTMLFLLCSTRRGVPGLVGWEGYWQEWLLYVKSRAFTFILENFVPDAPQLQL